MFNFRLLTPFSVYSCNRHDDNIRNNSGDSSSGVQGQGKNDMFDCLFFLVFNATFNNISVISWGSVLLVEETGVPGENHLPEYTPPILDKYSGPVTFIAWNDCYIYY